MTDSDLNVLSKRVLQWTALGLFAWAAYGVAHHITHMEAVIAIADRSWYPLVAFLLFVGANVARTPRFRARYWDRFPWAARVAIMLGLAASSGFVEAFKLGLTPWAAFYEAVRAVFGVGVEAFGFEVVMGDADAWKRPEARHSILNRLDEHLKEYADAQAELEETLKG